MCFTVTPCIYLSTSVQIVQYHSITSTLCQCFLVYNGVVIIDSTHKQLPCSSRITLLNQNLFIELYYFSLYVSAIFVWYTIGPFWYETMGTFLFDRLNDHFGVTDYRANLIWQNNYMVRSYRDEIVVTNITARRANKVWSIEPIWYDRLYGHYGKTVFRGNLAWQAIWPLWYDRLYSHYGMTGYMVTMV